MALEFDAFFVDATKAFEREHLEAAGIGEQRPIPCHELVKAAELLDDVLAGTDVQVVGVREDDLRADGFEIGGRQRADGRLRADRHEDRRRNDAVRQNERPRPRRA